jgi:hypothetical protein
MGWCQETSNREVQYITQVWEARKKNWEKELTFYRECTDWVANAGPKLRAIRAQAQSELKRIEKWQALEDQELFSLTEVPEDDSDEPVDLNQAIANALASHAIKQSPADYLSLRGYGDSFESTHLEKIGERSRNLLGLRGIDAVQVSSHRGPPTDRPHDKPPPWKGASRGYLSERAETRHFTQLASFSRGLNCSSGNAIPLQTMQFGGCTPSNNSASHAARTSQESSTRASRAGRLRGVVGSGLTGYVCDKWSPSSKPGS